MQITFYGVRGSTPSPEPDTVKYGGNTSCVLLETEDGSTLIFDAGTGIRKLGNKLVTYPFDSLPIYLLLSHAHWDHIQGLPSFRPIYQKDREIRLVSTAQKGEAALAQMAAPYFPVSADQLRSNIQFIPLNSEEELTIGEAKVSTLTLNHPGGGLAYRVDTPQGSMAYITDNELDPPEQPTTSYEQWLKFISGVDILIHDATYVDEERKQTHGWGHSLVSQAMQLAADAQLANLILFHHKPTRTDSQLDEILENCQQQIKKTAPDRKVFMAKEGDCYSVLSSHLTLCRT